MRHNGKPTTDAQALNALVTADGATGGFIKDSQAGSLPATATNDSATAGTLGELIESSIAIGSAVALTNNTTANVTSISLTPGDWDVRGVVLTNPNGATVQTAIYAAIHTTSATLPTAPAGGAFALWSGSLTGASMGLPTGVRRISVAVTTTVYLVTYVSFITSTNAAYGYIGARRVR